MMSYDELAAVCGDDDVADWATYFSFTPDGNVVDEKTGGTIEQNVFHPVSEDAPQNVALFKERVCSFAEITVSIQRKIHESFYLPMHFW